MRGAFLVYTVSCVGRIASNVVICYQLLKFNGSDMIKVDNHKGGFNNEKMLYGIHDIDLDIQLYWMQEGCSRG